MLLHNLYLKRCHPKLLMQQIIELLLGQQRTNLMLFYLLHNLVRHVIENARHYQVLISLFGQLVHLLLIITFKYLLHEIPKPFLLFFDLEMLARQDRLCLYQDASGLQFFLTQLDIFSLLGFAKSRLRISH